MPRGSEAWAGLETQSLEDRVLAHFVARLRGDPAEPRNQPTGWVAYAPHVWEPVDYDPGPWELRPPLLDTPDAVEAERARCQPGVPGALAHFATRWCWTLHVDDPRGPRYRRLPAYPYLVDFLNTLQEPANVHSEKSRQMLTSWAWMVVFLWDISFRDNWPTLVASRRSREVDDGGEVSTPDSLLGKLRFMHQHLPPFLQAPLVFRRHLISNPSRSSYVKGETGKGDSVSRGPAYARALLDEAAYIKNSETVFKGVRQASKSGTALNSTPNGKGNVFARIRLTQESTFRRVSMHWTQHPEYARGLYCTCGWQATDTHPERALAHFHAHPCTNPQQAPPRPREVRSPWYDAMCRDLTPEQVASELDISYEGSRRGRVYGSFDIQRHGWNHQVQVVDAHGRPLGERRDGESPEDYRRRYLCHAILPGKPLIITWDFGVGAPASVLLGQVLDEDTMRIRWLDEIEKEGVGYDWFKREIVAWWYAAWLVAQRGVVPIAHYGDPAGRNRESTLESWISNLAQGLPVEQWATMVREGRLPRDPRTGQPLLPRMVVQHTDSGSMMEWIDFIHGIIRDDAIEVSHWCARLIDGFHQYHYPTDSDGSPLQGAHLPVHDEYSHRMDALRYSYRTRWTGRLARRTAPAASRLALLRAGNDDGDHERGVIGREF